MSSWDKDDDDRGYGRRVTTVMETGADVGPADDEWWGFVPAPSLELAGMALLPFERLEEPLFVNQAERTLARPTWWRGVAAGVAAAFIASAVMYRGLELLVSAGR